MLIFCGIVFHIVFLLSIFDIYFKSPVIDGVREYSPSKGAPASRLVLFSADGLRIESLLRSPSAPYLKSVMKNRGTWGVSNTKVPTESRPGHVAIIAGFYEDPSAIAKGWKENPVDFDSVFNRSFQTWSWGSPDILPMFAKGAVGDHVYTDYYSSEEEDFSGKISTSALDIWVFDKVEKFFATAKTNIGVEDKLKKDKLIFFLHLLGLDTAGHTYKPYSDKYEENIKTVDNGVKNIEKIIEDYFGHDNKTVYIFTADHGMTDWGSHGAGDDHETQTPLIAWGAGIATPTNSQQDLGNRIDVNQVDICPLMAALIGIPVPVNSMGVLQEEYFGSNTELKAKSLHSNARQMLAQYDRKREIVENEVIMKIYTPFTLLSKTIVDETIEHLDSLLEAQDYEQVVKMSKETIALSLLGLTYYQNYYQTLLLNCMTLSFLGWICWLFTVIFQRNGNNKRLEMPSVSRSYLERFFDLHPINIFFRIFLSAVIIIINVQNLPIQYNIYCSLPVLIWWKVLLSYRVWIDFFTFKGENSSLTKFLKLFLTITVYVVGLLILIYTFFYRWVLSIGLVGLSIFPLLPSYRKKIPILLLIVWINSNIILTGFSFTPVVGHSYSKLVFFSGLLWVLVSCAFLYFHSLKMVQNGKETKVENIMMVLSPLTMLLAMQIKDSVNSKFESMEGLSSTNQVLSWILAISSLLSPFFTSQGMYSRLFSIFSNLGVFFLLLSVSHETLFLLVFGFNLLCWLSIEYYLNNPMTAKISLHTFEYLNNLITNKSSIERGLNAEDFRRSFIFMLYIILSFFGTGNIASINSFDPQWVRCFISQFSPFVMGSLIICKTLIPFLYVACTFCAVNQVVKAPTGQLFLIVLIFSDFMGLYFLHLVKNTGSWLEIGTSISHYVIMETTVLFVSLLYGLGYLMTGVNMWIESPLRSSLQYTPEPPQLKPKPKGQ